MISWRDVDAVVPAVLSIPERADSLRDLLVSLSRQCPGLRVRVLPQYDRPDTREGIARHAFETLAAGLQGFSRPWVVYLEEDVELAPDFGVHLLETLNEVDSRWIVGAVSFFSTGRPDAELIRQGAHLYPSRRPYVYAQCVALRQPVAEAWGRFLIPWQERQTRNRYALDMALGDCCDDLGVRLLVHLPSLVQHRRIPSAFNHTAHPESQSYQQAPIQCQ